MGNTVPGSANTCWYLTCDLWFLLPCAFQYNYVHTHEDLFFIILDSLVFVLSLHWSLIFRFSLEHIFNWSGTPTFLGCSFWSHCSFCDFVTSIFLIEVFNPHLTLQVEGLSIIRQNSMFGCGPLLFCCMYCLVLVAF